MRAYPQPDADEARDNAAFAAVLNAFARPGTVHALPEPGARAVALALIDRECRVFADTEPMQALLRTTGASIVPAELADHVFTALRSDGELARFARLTVGDRLYPDSGATVIAPATVGAGQALRLTGPGIETQTEIRLDGLSPRLWALRAGLCRYPLGVDLLFHDGAQVLAIPRSTSVEVL